MSRSSRVGREQIIDRNTEHGRNMYSTEIDSGVVREL